MFNQTSQNSAVASRTSAKMTLNNKNNKLGTYYIKYMMCAKPKSLTNVPSFVDVAFVSQNSTNTIGSPYIFGMISQNLFVHSQGSLLIFLFFIFVLLRPWNMYKVVLSYDC